MACIDSNSYLDCFSKKKKKMVLGLDNIPEDKSTMPTLFTGFYVLDACSF